MMFKYQFFLSLFSTALVVLSVNAHAADMIDYPQIKIQALNKSTARTETIIAKVGSTIEYGSLFIKTQACRKSEPMDKPEDAAFLQIWEVPVGKNKSEWAFSGWMFSSSPAVSAMDHSIYDVWVLSCFDPDEKIIVPVNKVIVNDVEVIDEPEDQIDVEIEDSSAEENVTIIQNAEPLNEQSTVEEDITFDSDASEDTAQEQEAIEVEPLDAIINDLSTYE